MPKRSSQNWDGYSTHRDAAAEASQANVEQAQPQRAAAPQDQESPPLEATAARRPAARRASEEEEVQTYEVPVRQTRRQLIKHQVSYRLPLDVINLIEAALDEAYASGERLTKEEAVTAAIRRTYGHLR